MGGEKIGRTIGFPTANLIPVPNPSELEPGVYFGTCVISGNEREFFCLPYFGPRYVVGKLQNVFEVYIFDLDADIYGQKVTVALHQFLRAPQNVTSLAELQKLLDKDKKMGVAAQKKLTQKITATPK